MDRTNRDLDRSPFSPPEPQSTLGLTLGIAATIAAGIIVVLVLLALQIDALASAPGSV